jgi:hypothetical protein
MVGLFIAALTFSSTTWAEEKGKWRGLGVLVETASKAVEIADQEGHSVFMLEYDGVIFNDNAESFLDKARYQVAHLGDTGGMVGGGYKTFTMGDGSQVFAKYEGTEAAPPVFKGKWQFIGGTGKYNGITGEGVYTFTAVSDTAAWDVLEGDYVIP